MSETKPKEKFNVYQAVTDAIKAELEKGVVPWSKPWSVPGMAPQNFKSGKDYSGINIFLLEIQASIHGYKSPIWMTYKQADERGGQVRKGEKGTMIVFWKMFPTKELDAKGKPKVIPVLRYYKVFNIAQIDGIDAPEVERPSFDFNQTANDLIIDMPDAPRILHAGDKAFYRQSDDTVMLPEPEFFKSSAHYYLTAYHELVHSTMHESRLGRKATGEGSYSKEELVAEMGAAMLAGMVGIEAPIIEHSAAYIQSWLNVINEDERVLMQAASQAQKAADFILARGQVSSD